MLKKNMSFEENLQRTMFTQQGEKTFIDKILSKEDIKQVQTLIKKQDLTREELLELLYLLTSAESKLLNFSAWDRYITLKYFVWIREFVKIAELFYDYIDDLKKRGTNQSKEMKQLIKNNRRLLEHNVKFLIDLYFNIGRTTMSLGATGALELIKNKYEITYPTSGVHTPMQQGVQHGS